MESKLAIDTERVLVEATQKLSTHLLSKWIAAAFNATY
jgi:hypothetical protein